MDFSSLSEKNDTTLQSDDLLEKYSSLKIQYENVCKQVEKCQQELHENKKGSQIAAELKEHLTSELEMWQKNEVKIKQEYSQKIQTLNEELEQLRHEKWKDSENFNNTIEILQNKIKTFESKENLPVEEKSICQMDNSKTSEDLKRLEEENSKLQALISELNMNSMNNAEVLEDLRNEIKNFKEREESLKINLQNKKDELASVTEMLHSAQEDFCGVNSELQQLKQQANIHAPKGNSLFAEVDDKRQEMVKSYSQLKDKVFQLNRELMSKQAELDSLLCEKKTLWEEYSGQATHHDAVLNRAYERRITDLEKENVQLHREIAQWYSTNLNCSSSNITQWISGVLEYYREENHRLTDEFTASSVDNLSKERKIRELHRQLITWRTKAMEANATISQLQTSLQHTERPKLLKDLSSQSPKSDQAVSPSKSDKGNLSRISNSSQDKENFIENRELLKEEVHDEVLQKPGILVTGGNKNKPVKKTNFK